MTIYSSIYSGWRSARSRARTETNLEASQARSSAAVDCVRRVLLRPSDFDFGRARLRSSHSCPCCARAFTKSCTNDLQLLGLLACNMMTPTVLLATALWAKRVNKLATQTDVRATHTQPLWCSDASSRSEQGERLRGRAGLKYGLTCPRPTGK